MEPIINKVANSGLVTIDLEEFYPIEEKFILDIKQQLFQELILKEKDFREFIKTHDWAKYNNSYVLITCTADAIVPTWAYMLLSTAAQSFAKEIYFGNESHFNELIFETILQNFNPENYTDKRVIIKGCSTKPVPTSAFVRLTTKLRPFAKSIMYGEPCSTVPIYKASISH